MSEPLTHSLTQLNETLCLPVKMAGVRDNLLNKQAVTRWHVRERLSSPPKVHSNPREKSISLMKYGRVAPLAAAPTRAFHSFRELPESPSPDDSGRMAAL